MWLGLCINLTLSLFKTNNSINKLSCNDWDSCSWHDQCAFPRPSSRDLRECTHVVQGNCILLSNRLAEPLLNDVLPFHDPVSMFVLNLQIRSRFSGPIRGLSCIFLTIYFLRSEDVTPHVTVHLFLSSGPVRNRQLRSRWSCIFLWARYLVTPPIRHWRQWNCKNNYSVGVMIITRTALQVLY